jgi:hypothetical protein
MTTIHPYTCQCDDCAALRLELDAEERLERDRDERREAALEIPADPFDGLPGEMGA